MRLIDADVLKQHIDKLPALPDGNFAGNHSALKALINMQPTIESSTNCSEFPNNSDTISRQAAIDVLRNELKCVLRKDCDRAVCKTCDLVMNEADIIEALTMAIDVLSAQPGWIPWDSGKFPKESGTYTVTAYDGAARRVTYAKYQKRLNRWELTGARAYWRVLAWCELPEPWKGEEHGASRTVLPKKSMR